MSDSRSGAYGESAGSTSGDRPNTAPGRLRVIHAENQATIRLSVKLEKMEITRRLALIQCSSGRGKGK
jgi:hypothetical protein